jgi:hypothetical protein
MTIFYSRDPTILENRASRTSLGHSPSKKILRVVLSHIDIEITFLITARPKIERKNGRKESDSIQYKKTRKRENVGNTVFIFFFKVRTM